MPLSAKIKILTLNSKNPVGMIKSWVTLTNGDLPYLSPRGGGTLVTRRGSSPDVLTEWLFVLSESDNRESKLQLHHSHVLRWRASYLAPCLSGLYMTRVSIKYELGLR